MIADEKRAAYQDIAFRLFVKLQEAMRGTLELRAPGERLARLGAEALRMEAAELEYSARVNRAAADRLAAVVSSEGTALFHNVLGEQHARAEDL